LKTSASKKKIPLVLRTWNPLGLIPILCVGVLLHKTFRLYNGSYFSLDDFNNLYWMQRATFPQMLGQLLNPSPAYFRPAGWMCYWVLLRLFDLNSASYHWLAWSFHSANTVLVYFILKRLTQSRVGAAVGAMLFASQVVFADLYWNFGTIFELLTVFFCFIGICLWTTERRNWWQVVLASLALLLAMKAKEMAITMPFVWLSYDLLLRRNLERRIAAHWLLPIGLGLWYTVSKALASHALITMPGQPYYMSINGSALVAGFSTYLNMLFRTNLPWQIWLIGLGVLFLLCLLLRSRLALFFQLYVFITFLPVIFMINHRFAFFWYLPFLGVCGLTAILAKNVAKMIETRNRPWLARTAAYSVFALLCWFTFLAHKHAINPARSAMRNGATEYRAFILGLRSLPPPAKGETIFFDSHPAYFNEGLLLSATQVAFGRTDLRVKLVSEFPLDARYCLRFHDSNLIRKR
jgi:hypothetical protein